MSSWDPPKLETPGTRVRVLGQIHCLHSENGAIILTLADGYGSLRCILMGHLANVYDALTLTLGTIISIHSEMCSVPPEQHAPNDCELRADFFTIIGRSVGDEEAITAGIESLRTSLDLQTYETAYEHPHPKKLNKTPFVSFVHNTRISKAITGRASSTPPNRLEHCPAIQEERGRTGSRSPNRPSRIPKAIIGHASSTPPYQLDHSIAMPEERGRKRSRSPNPAWRP